MLIVSLTRFENSLGLLMQALPDVKPFAAYLPIPDYLDFNRTAKLDGTQHI
jgi:hypothetical protein